MAINVYTPGCHLLCHDDVIGTRRISWILYLTDPDHPWKPEWGGALRLYPTEVMKASDGTDTVVPTPDFTVVHPPAFNQLSFFTIQPGLSFHDVEEVYKRKEGEGTNDGGRVRMAISGWFHIPQEGEDGYELGLEEKLTERSSLSQLQSKADEFDLPQPNWRDLELPEKSKEGLDFTEKEFDWLLRFISPSYLAPDTVEQLQESFEENSVISLVDFLAPKFAVKLKNFISAWDAGSPPTIPTLKGSKELTEVARPPHKQKFLYRRSTTPQPPQKATDTPLDLLLEQLFPSPLFARWLCLITGLSLSKTHSLARRFRKGSDYTLATSYEDDNPQLEVTLGITPTSGWGDDGDTAEEDEEDVPANGDANGKASNGKGKGKSKESKSGETATKEGSTDDEDNVGGYEVYMAGDDDEDDATMTDAGVDGPSNTGAGERRKARADPAVYRSSGDDDEDGVLFSTPANWNNLGIVLRDKGALRFVKYVSESAPGDRWDVTGSFGVVPEEEDEE
jgi:prolyl 3-hydroxylase /prolyl 3,4-dihydroxylase